MRTSATYSARIPARNGPAVDYVFVVECGRHERYAVAGHAPNGVQSSEQTFAPLVKQKTRRVDRSKLMIGVNRL
jgi:hypothetical protein